MNPATAMAFMNLHDAFMNANLQRKHMRLSSLESDVNLFHISDRARFERSWVTFLYVLYEAWISDEAAAAREHLAKSVDLSGLTQLIADGESKGIFRKLFEARSYMCHRDRREYWNEGRTSFYGLGPFLDELHDSFSAVFLTSFAIENSKLNAPE